MRQGMSKKVEEYKEGLQQKWVYNSHSRYHSDQFGCRVQTRVKQYTLYVKEVKITTFYSLRAAQLVSTIILNDMIMHMPTD